MSKDKGSQLAPPEKRNTRAMTHGASASLQLTPRVEELREAITEIVPTGNERDVPAITLLAWQLARIERANSYLAEHDLLDKQGRPRPVLRVLSTWENSAARLCDQLGLTPTSRAKLGVDHVKGRALEEHLAANYKKGKP